MEMGGLDSGATDGVPQDQSGCLGAGITADGFAAGQRVFGRFLLVRELGRGAMGVVWLARDEVLDRDLALKFLPAVVASDISAVADLKRETRRALVLTHPNIVRVYDFWTDERHAAIAMEYVEGSTLAQLLERRGDRAFAPAELQGWLVQLGGALVYAHERAQVVHRDLKPGNLIIDASGQLKVADFGIAAAICEATTRVSRVAGALGTPAYMSPQQMMGVPPTVSDDVYSLGATLYELLAGVSPFTGANIVEQVQFAIPESVVQRRARQGVAGAPLPPEWDSAIASCLAKDPTRRPRSVQALLDRLGLVGTRWVAASEPATAAAGHSDLASRIAPLPQSGSGEAPPPLPPVAAPPEQEEACSVPYRAAFFTVSLLQMLRWRVIGLMLILSLIGLYPTIAFLRMRKSLGQSTYNPVSGQTLGTVLFTSKPAGALVRFTEKRHQEDAEFRFYGEELRTPITLTFQPGSFGVMLVREGYRPVTRRLRVGAGERNRLEVILERVPGAEPTLDPADLPAPGTPHCLADLDLTMQWISPGTFTMGHEHFSNGKPLPLVTLTQGFWLGRTEVTERQWSLVMGRPLGPSEWDKFPVGDVTYNDAMVFCRKLTRREKAAGRLPEGFEYSLPSEAQWEYACRAGTTGDHAGPLDALAWYRANSGDRRHAVGTKTPNDWGLFDMHGNVGEWCWDYFAELPTGPQTDPVGTDGGDDRVYRGGTQRLNALRCRSAMRFPIYSSLKDPDVGFRVALAPVR